METYDIVMLVVLGAATLWGALKGLAWQLASLASMVVSYLVAYKFRGELATKIDATPPWNVFLAMLILYVATSSAIWLIFQVLSNTMERMKLKDFDRQMGALFGFGKGVLFCGLVTLFAATLLGETARRTIVRSKSGLYIARHLHSAEAIMPAEIKQVLEPHLREFDEQFDDAGPRESSPKLGEAGGGEGMSWDRITGSKSDADSLEGKSKSLWDGLRSDVQKKLETEVERGAQKAWDSMREPLDNASRSSNRTSR
ncbi:MAG: CvpA family protein [Pirellulales bacterium]